MNWLKIEPRIRGHWKVRRFERVLDIERGWTHVVALWLWAAEYAEDGDASKLDNAELAVVMELDGLAAEANLFQVLKDCGLVDQDGRIHDWEEFAERHRGAAERMRKWREAHPDRVVADRSRKRSARYNLAPISSPRDVTRRNAGARGEERRGEDRRGEKTGGVGGEAGPCVECVVAISFLNQTASLQFPINKGTTRLLHARHQEYTLGDVKRVIRVKTSEWLQDAKMRAFLRPRTLFGPENFAQYVGQPDPDDEPLIIPMEGRVCRDCRKRLFGTDSSRVRCDACQDVWNSANQ